MLGLCLISIWIYGLHMDTPETTVRSIAEAVSQALADAGISRKEAVEATGIPLTTLQRRLTGHSPLRIDELAALATLAGTTVPALMEKAQIRGAA